MNHHERLDNRLILRGVGTISPNTALYNNKNGVIMIKQQCSCDHHHNNHTNMNTGTNDLCHTSNQAAEYNFELYKGESLDFDVVYKDASKMPVNLLGYKARCVAQYNDKTFTINATICDALNGMIHLDMSSYETSRIFTLDYKYTNVTEYTYQLELISPSKFVYRIMEGTITVKPQAGSC